MASLNISTPAIEREFSSVEAYWQRALDLEFEKGSAAEREERSRHDYQAQVQAHLRAAFPQDGETYEEYVERTWGQK